VSFIDRVARGIKKDREGEKIGHKSVPGAHHGLGETGEEGVNSQGNGGSREERGQWERTTRTWSENNMWGKEE